MDWYFFPGSLNYSRFNIRGPFGRSSVVPLTVRSATRARLRLDAVGNWDGRVALGTDSSSESTRLGPCFRRGLFHGVHHVRCIGECGRTVPKAKSRPAGSYRGRVDTFVWPSSDRLAGEAEFSRGCGDRNCARRARLFCCVAERSYLRRFSRHSFLLIIDYWLSRSRDGALAESRRASSQRKYAARRVEWFPARLCVRIWVDAVHRSDSGDGARARRCKRNRGPWGSAARGLLGGARHPIPVGGSRHRPSSQLL